MNIKNNVVVGIHSLMAIIRRAMPLGVLALTACLGGVGTTVSIPSISATAVTAAQSLTAGTAMTSFSPLTPSGGTIPYTYRVTSGTLPTGLSLNASTGMVTGTPTVTYPVANVVFTVQDANSVVASTTSTVSFTVVAALPAGYVSEGGLIWMPVSSTRDNYAQATTLCAGTINGSSGWRLPTQAELSALYTSGAMNGQGWMLDYTWSSTLNSGTLNYSVNLGTGSSNGLNDTANLSLFLIVACVT